MLVSYSWLKEYLGNDAPTANKLAELLTFHSFEIEGVNDVNNDVVIDVDVLPNRSSDCLCHRGIAREIATLTGIPLEVDPLKVKPDLADTDQIKVQVFDTKACPRFTASLITGIEIKESPDWLKERLAALGQRSINNIVDATNYVMFAIGQPIHAYDADLFPQVDGAWRFGVRFAEEGEKVSLIAEGGKDEDRIVDLKGTELLIVDESSNTPIGLAGVKGGRFAGIHSGTKNVIIEAAHFDPILTRQTARRLGIVIDASKRFENEPSRELPPYAQSEIVKLISDIAGGTYQGTVDEYAEKQTVSTVEVSADKVNGLLGLDLKKEEMKDILERVGCQVDSTGVGLLCTGPWERTDLNIEEDFIEEIGRVHGSDHVESVVPETAPLTELNKRHYYSEQIRGVLIGLGFSEVVTSSFRKKDDIQLANALAADKSCLRSGLTANVNEVLEKNAGHADLLGTNDTRVFEIGTVFDKHDKTVGEHVALAIGVRLKASGYSGKEDKVLNEVLAALNSELGTELKGATDKGVFETNVNDLLGQLPDPDHYEPPQPVQAIAYKQFSVYPAVSRDIAMWVSEGVKAAEVEGVLNEVAGDLRVRTTLFDEFTKDGRTSYAFRLVFQSMDRTLTDEEVNGVMEKVYKTIQEKGWEVR